jgi:hypothetical protein
VSQVLPPFEEFLHSLSQLTTPAGPPPAAAVEPYEHAAEQLKALDQVDRAALTALLSEHSEWVLILGSVVGLSQEQLKNILRHRLGTAGFVKLAQERAAEVVALLDEEYGLVDRVRAERHREWSYGDVLFERIASRSRAGRAIGRGRQLEDDVEEVVVALGLPYDLRTQFVGRAGRTGSCDLAIPAAGESALIVCAVKGFDSTGSKLTDAVREIEAMAEVRRPRQFVYAVVDGIGWLSRQADLRRIHALAVERSIDGLFSRAQMGTFREELGQAAASHHLP